MKAKKVMALVLAAVMLMCATVATTVAYLTDSESVKNTFSVGKLAITMDEAKVDEYGKPQKNTGSKENPVWTPVNDRKDADRVFANSYKLIPGHTYTKDPTVHVKTDSEKTYVRMQVKVTANDLAALKQAFPREKYTDWYVDVNTTEVFLLQMLTPGWNNTNWDAKGFDAETGIYEFWYKGIVDIANYTDTDADGYIDLEPLFTTIKVPHTATGTELEKLAGVEIDIVAHAIQADGFANAEAAWSDTTTDWANLPNP